MCGDLRTLRPDWFRSSAVRLSVVPAHLLHASLLQFNLRRHVPITPALAGGLSKGLHFDPVPYLYL